MVADGTGQAVAKHAPGEGDEFAVALEHAVEEGEPHRAIAARRDGGDLGDQVLAGMRAQLAGAEVNRAARRVQEPGLSVPILCAGRVAAIGAGQPLDGSHGFGTRYGGGELRRSVPRDDLGGGRAGEAASEVEGFQRLVSAPALPVP